MVKHRVNSVGLMQLPILLSCTMSTERRRKSRGIRIPSPLPAPQKKNQVTLFQWWVLAMTDRSKKLVSEKATPINQSAFYRISSSSSRLETQHYTLTMPNQNAKVTKLLNNKLTQNLLRRNQQIGQTNHIPFIEHPIQEVEPVKNRMWKIC